ncbi:hypothetical protein GQ43DRAFT_141274 [Delitschia confertaspora ATCC 74209]|uniref:Uncharacterized protein n=1 Tax=Delitschia confertaspora ATCC 74209 TaxID=1513339 RepID=A0A9P4JY33_9PLEO|nr:hypothetical protein GQ43DRAFT_141274 [Delitschia confertaspora ATCC 74209]
MPIRNLFRRAGGADTLDEAQRSTERSLSRNGANGRNPLDIKQPAEYKLSEINDSGVYLPVRAITSSTLAPRETKFLALEVQHLNHILEPPHLTQRE